MFQENCSSGGRGLQARAEISYVNAEEAKNLVAAKGYSILDIRDRVQYERAHIKQCYHVPLFIEDQDNDIGISSALVPVHLLAFMHWIKMQLPGLCCVFRSSAAANQLEQAGFQNIACITSGLQSVSPECRESGLGNTVQGKVSAVLETVLICAFLFITFFPDQAEKLFQLAPSS
ncbi:hypothetical protein SAY86_024248 [Trapa natans]|uniref:Rhodanese domain-containing protein n=1 Tax=Trapa natans TaxID=22666 RepID=A0AAN7LZ06_TRANT|nr:hypothetical protein SAY86_024248 [Trapa natans]